MLAGGYVSWGPDSSTQLSYSDSRSYIDPIFKKKKKPKGEEYERLAHHHI